MTHEAMFQAIADDDLDAVRRLLQANMQHACEVDPDNGRSALHAAAAQGRAAILGELMRHVLIHPGVDEQGGTPLLLALRRGHADCAELLLARSGPLHAEDRGAIAALADGGLDRPELAAELLRRGAWLRSPSGRTLGLERAGQQGLDGVVAVIRARLADTGRLFDAIAADDAATIDALLGQQRVSPDTPDAVGWPPLARAVDAGAIAALDALLRHGADLQPRLPDRRSLTVLAIDGGRPAVTRRLLARLNAQWQDLDALPRLREAIEADDVHGAAAAATGLQGTQLDAALRAAAWLGRHTIAMKLLALGGHLPGVAPAVLWGDRELLDALLARGAAVNEPGRDGLPVLQLLALGVGDAAAIGSRLLELGADPARAAAFADAQGRGELAAQLRAMADVAPFRWQREARARRITQVVFTMDKADGVIFNPTDPDHPLLVGGDYDGPRPMTASRGLWEMQGSGLFDRLPAAQRQIIEKLAAGEDFGIDEALAAAGDRRRISAAGD
jgi:ankyrin repeat protein